MKKLILASTSPRRRRLLEKFLGEELEVIAPEIDESKYRDLPPREQVKRIALAKAESIASRISGGVVVAADTIVVIDGEVLGKPYTIEEAKSMLRKLSGRKHKVITGIAVIDVESGEKVIDLVESEVLMRKLSELEIELYVRSGEPMGKAGGYAIQGLGALLVKGISGCFYNVVGLPISRLYEILSRLGINLLERAAETYGKACEGI